MKSVKVFDDLSMMPIGVMNLNQLRDEMGDAGTTDYNDLINKPDLSVFIEKSATSGLVKNDGTIDTNTYLTQHQDISGKEDVTTIVAPVNTTDVTLPITTLTTEIGKYYRIDVPIETLAITLPAMGVVTSVKKVDIYFTAGNTPAVTITSADSKDIYYQDGFELEAGKTYKISALFDGSAWVVSTLTIILPPPMNIITYSASAKLYETTSTGSTSGGLHTNAFSGTSGQLTITSHTFNNGVGTIEFNDDVTSIGNYAFYNCKSLTSIEIPNSVTSIGTAAFQNCSGLTSIVIPSGVTSIGNFVFNYCESLTSIEIPNSVTSIGTAAFQNCSGLTSIVIPSGVTSIGESAFAHCSSLTSIVIPSGVTSIGDNAFQLCSGLTSITCNATTAPTIDSATFQGVKTNGTLTVPVGSTGYDKWMRTVSYYLGYYNWTKVEQ